MKNLFWNEGMSVGIKAIDNDHKKILSLIARIADALDTDSTEEIIKEIFLDLENYVTYHFSREEELLQTVDYPGLEQHKASHQQFIDKIPELKDELLRNNSIEVAENVNFFLHNWIINHILIEDMAYTPSIHKYQLRQTKTLSFAPFSQASRWLSRHVTLTRRIFITAVLPILGLCILSFMILADNYQQYKNMQLLSGLNQIVFRVNELSHNLQVERGLSAGFISPDSRQFSSDLFARRKLTNSSLQVLYSELERHSDLLSIEKVRGYINRLKIDFARLDKQRAKIDERKSSSIQTQAFYNQTIEQLLSIENHLLQIDMDSKLASSLMAISALSNLKELTGQQRALGTTLIEQGKADIEQFQQFSILQGRRFDSLQTFNYSANEQQKRICDSLCDSQLLQLSDTQIFIDLMQGKVISLSSKQWFDSLSENMDKLKTVNDNLIFELNRQTDKQLSYFLNRFYLVMAIIAAFFLLNTLLLILLNHSIISPIQRLTGALKDITTGRKNVQIFDEFAHDEIAAMFKAYETLRRKLLQADIAEDLIKDQRRLLRYRKHEQKLYQELASIDTLTGALNRRKFNEIIGKEIDNTKKNKDDLSILLLDIDYFKKVNDHYGHGVGDKALQLFYQRCHHAVRISDVIARIGGEEFVILMPHTNQQQAAVFAERVRKTVDDNIMMIDNHHIHMTVSIGVTQWHSEHFKNAEELLSCVDKALYEAKNSGRNQVAVKSC